MAAKRKSARRKNPVKVSVPKKKAYPSFKKRMLAKNIEKVRASQCTVLKLNAGNDTNGNPRRGWLISAPSVGEVAFVDEGYMGSGAFDTTFSASDAKVLKKAADRGGEIGVSPSFYRQIKKTLGVLAPMVSR